MRAGFFSRVMRVSSVSGVVAGAPGVAGAVGQAFGEQGAQCPSYLAGRRVELGGEFGGGRRTELPECHQQRITVVVPRGAIMRNISTTDPRTSVRSTRMSA